MSAGARIVHYDASRLIARGVRASPTGIDRVDLAYARHLLAAGVDLRPVAWLGGALRTVDRAALAAYLDRLARLWAGAGGAADPAVAARVAAFLAGAPVARFRPPALPGPLGRALAHLAARVTGRAGGLADRTLTRDGLGPRPRFRPDPAGGLYLNVSHHHLEKPELFAALGPTVHKVVFVHDVIPLDFPEYCRAGDDLKHARRMRNVAAHADLVLVNSAHTAERVRSVAAGFGRAELDVVVAPLGVDLPARPAAVAGSSAGRDAGTPATDGDRGARPADVGAVAPFPAARPYFLTVGTIEARKNHLLLLNVWRRLAETLGESAPALVVVGRRGWEIEAVVDMLERCPALGAHVLETGPVDDRLLARLMAGARALLMPSFAEGFGLPVAEALAAGTPVVASDIPAHREIAGDVPDYLDPLDAMGWIAAIGDFSAVGSERRAAQMGRLAGYRAPGWEGHFAAVEGVWGLSRELNPCREPLPFIDQL